MLPKWVAHWFATIFEIKQPDDRHKRTKLLAKELNTLLETIRIYCNVYVWKYKDHHFRRNEDRPSWIKEFSKEQASSDLLNYTCGFYFYHDLRSGMHRLLLQLILPRDCIFEDLIMNINRHKWASKHNRSFQDIKEQNLYKLKYVGFLFRSNYSMTASNKLQLLLEEKAKKAGMNIKFGLSFKVVPFSSGKGKEYNKESAVKAVCISTNLANQYAAWDLLHKWYNVKDPMYPLGIPMKFIPAKDNPDIANNSITLQNVSIMYERQKIFLRDTVTIPCSHLADPDTSTKSGKPIRQTLFETKIKTSTSVYKGGYLFHAINTKQTLGGDRIQQFSFHRVVKKEARNVIGGLLQYIEAEVGEDPEIFCHAHLVDSTHSWNTTTRMVKIPRRTISQS